MPEKEMYDPPMNNNAPHFLKKVNMIDRDLEIRTPDGDMTTFISHPEGDGPYPLILFLMDAPGKREELHDMARRFAAKGLNSVLRASCNSSAESLSLIA